MLYEVTFPPLSQPIKIVLYLATAEECNRLKSGFSTAN